MCDRTKDARYATTIESFRSIASSTTALVRSTVSNTEFICRLIGSKGASRSTSESVSTQFLVAEYFGHTPSIVPAAVRQGFGITMLVNLLGFGARI